MTTPRSHALYRFYDTDGALLYVGITLDPGARWRSHRDDKPWWHEVAGITLEVFPDRDSVLAAEAAAIVAEHPLHNVVHNRGHAPALPAWGTRPEHMPDLCHDHCVPAGDFTSMYYPFHWENGRAYYECARGHTWTCGWAHRHTGSAPQHRGQPVEEVA